MGYAETASQFGGVGTGTASGSANASSGVSASSFTGGFGSILNIGSDIYGGYLQNKIYKANAELSKSQGNYENTVAQFNAAVARANAEAIRASSDLDIERQKRQAKAVRGSQVAGYAKSGVKLEGSPLSVMIDSAQQSKLDQAITEYNTKTSMAQTEMQAKGFETSGRFAKVQGETQANLLRAEGRFNKKQSIIKGATSLLSMAAGFL